VGPRAGLDRCGKSRFPPGFNPQTVQLVASPYTDYASDLLQGCTNYTKKIRAYQHGDTKYVEVFALLRSYTA
jgi:hypothetical protein